MSGANPAVLRAMAMQLETMLKTATQMQMPDYLQNSAKQFVEDLKKYAGELEAAQNKIVTV